MMRAENKLMCLGGCGAIHKYMFPKMDVVTSFLLSQKNIYIYNAAKAMYCHYDTNKDNASSDDWRKYDSNKKEPAVDNTEGGYLFKAVS